MIINQSINQSIKMSTYIAPLQPSSQCASCEYARWKAT